MEEVYIEGIKSKLKEVKETSDRIIPIWPDGWKGTAIRPNDIKDYRERWDIIEERLR